MQNTGSPMRYAEITQAIIDSGYRVNVGATPAATVSASLSELPRIAQLRRRHAVDD
jgi:hypothetical protein